MNRERDSGLSKEETMRFEDLERSISMHLESLKKLNRDAKQRKNDDIKSMIRYYNDMTDTVENRRIRIHDFSLQLLAISVTGIALLISQFEKITTFVGKCIFWTVMIILVVQVLSSLISTFVYIKQSNFNKYPFLKLEKYGNKWKWFYYGNKEILRIDPGVFRPKKFERTIEPYLSGLSDFIRNYAEEDLNEEIVNNVQQLYLLQVHNYYKNRFYLQLTRIWEWSIKITLIIIIITVIITVGSSFLTSTILDFFTCVFAEFFVKLLSLAILVAILAPGALTSTLK